MRALLVGLCLAVGSPASGLSCLPWSVPSAYLAAEAAEETYVIALGRFSFSRDALAPLPVENGSARTRRVEAGFIGALFTGEGFGFFTELDVTILAPCAGPWCASLAPGVETLAFLEARGDGYHLALDPCGGNAFARPRQAQIAQVLACHEGGLCAPAERER